MNVRFATPGDAQAFAEWAVNNPDIPDKDIRAAMSENNPTVRYLVIEEDGFPLLYVPVYCAIRIAYLGFNPEADDREKIEAMNAMLKAIQAFAGNFGVKEIGTLTKEGYSVAKWAKKHGFEPDDRQLFTARA